jgi:hypothetical protein
MFIFRSRQKTELKIFHALLKEIESKKQRHWFRLVDLAAWQEIQELEQEQKVDIVIAMVNWMEDPSTQESWIYWTIRDAISILLRCELPFQHDDLVVLLAWTAYHQPILTTIKILKQYLTKNPLSPEIQERIAPLVSFTEVGGGRDAQTNRWIVQLRELAKLNTDSLLITPGEAWADMAIADILSTNDDKRIAWKQLIELCAQCSQSQPTRKWRKTAVSYQQVITYESFKQSILPWFALADKPRTQPIQSWPHWRADPNQMLHAANADILKGLVWLCVEREDNEIARGLTELAVTAYRKVPGVGPRSLKLGNACVWALGNMPGLAGVSQLALLKTRIKLGAAQKGIEKALTIAAERQGLPRDEIEEIIVPTYGLEDVGVRREELGEYTAVLEITGTTSTELGWLRSDGKSQKSAPKAIKDHYPDDYQELRQATKDIQKMIPAQRDRIENLYLAQKQWPYRIWRERYNDHPLIGTLARRLIWKFSWGEQTEAGIWHNGRLVSYNDTPIDWLNDEAIVELWHTIHASTENILAWRNWLETHKIQQPFKQAHRELYLLTDAERNTHSYSNRFAAHIIRQHQFNALAAARGWKNKLRLMVDDEYPPASRYIPAWGIRAEFWVEGAGDEYGVDTNETGTFRYLTTDQVRFYAIDAPEHRAHAGGGGYHTGRFGGLGPGEPVPLGEVPAFVFTEIMRDVDLFVGVASVGNDPTWQNGGPDGRYQNYWAQYSFGELSQTAETRKQVLERLVPRLKIARQCQIDGHFLIVDGHLRTYKIHLGSGNILMSPNDQYLCIVPGGSHNQSETIHLPFEGDRTLAIILSKAFLLANDSSITDTTITRQLKL